MASRYSASLSFKWTERRPRYLLALPWCCWGAITNTTGLCVWREWLRGEFQPGWNSSLPPGWNFIAITWLVWAQVSAQFFHCCQFVSLKNSITAPAQAHISTWAEIWLRLHEFFSLPAPGGGEGGRGTCRIHDGGVRKSFILQNQKMHEPETLHPKTYLASKFSAQKNTGVSTSILIYSIKQTWLPKNICDRSWPKKKPRA